MLVRIGGYKPQVDKLRRSNKCCMKLPPPLKRCPVRNIPSLVYSIENTLHVMWHTHNTINSDEKKLPLEATFSTHYLQILVTDIVTQSSKFVFSWVARYLKCNCNQVCHLSSPRILTGTKKLLLCMASNSSWLMSLHISSTISSADC